MSDIVEKKKRGRRKKEDVQTEEVTVEVKKRGRKPKGGKLIVKQAEPESNSNTIVNVILHLRCSLGDLIEYNVKTINNELTYNPEMPPEIQTYNGDEIRGAFSEYEQNKQKQGSIDFAYNERATLCQSCIKQNETNSDDRDVNIKDVNVKLKQLKINLYKNTLQDKKSSCFWCTYEFDNPPCYVPKYEMDDKIYGYGSFCRPECAVAYLMKENMDDSSKFERYHLLNQIYSKVYDYKKNIKPAPDPHYLLDKFFGNLTIQEYRKLLKTEHLLLVVDKPMTRVLPELFEDNDNFTLGIYGDSNNTSQNNSTSMYKVKRQSEKQPGPSKTSIMRDKFGLS
jgi:hypothetical protein